MANIWVVVQRGDNGHENEIKYCDTEEAAEEYLLSVQIRDVYCTSKFNKDKYFIRPKGVFGLVPEPPVTQASQETIAAVCTMTAKWPVKE